MVHLAPHLILRALVDLGRRVHIPVLLLRGILPRCTATLVLWGLSIPLRTVVSKVAAISTNVAGTRSRSTAWCSGLHWSLGRGGLAVLLKCWTLRWRC